MTDLFTRDPETFDGIHVPDLTRAEATLNFSSRIQIGGGFKSMDDDVRIEIFECTLPESSGVFQTWTDRTKDGNVQRQKPFVISTTHQHSNEGTLINEFLKAPENKGSPAANWLIENAARLNSARRYWQAKKEEETLASIDRRIADLQEDRRLQSIRLSLSIIEVREDSYLDPAERKRTAREYGATDEDIK